MFKKKRGVKETAEKTADPQSCMFGVGVMPDESAPLAPTSAYQSQFTNARDLDFQTSAVETSDAPATSTARPRLTPFDFALPVARYLSVLTGGLILSKLSASLPSLLPSPAFIAWVTHYLSLIVLFFNFLPALGKTYTGPLSGLLPSSRVRRLDPVGRRILRRYGRLGWFIWRLTQPLWGLLMLGGGCMAVFGAGLGLRALWEALPSMPAPTPPPPVAKRPPTDIFDGEPSTLGKGLMSMMRIGRTLIFFLGVIFMLAGVMNYMMERPWASKILGAVMCWSMAGMIHLMSNLSVDTPTDLGAELGN